MVAVVAGGSGKVGGAIARSLARHGAAVVIQYHRNARRAEAVRDALVSAGARAITASCDARSPAAVDALYRAAADAFGGVDILVNAVHPSAATLSVAEMTWEDWAPQLAAMQSHFLLCKHALPYLRKSENGRIIYISGGLSKRFFPGKSAYSAAKGAMNNMCRTLALEEAPYGTTVNIIAPGRVMTDGFAGAAADSTVQMAAAFTAPLARRVTGADVGEAVVFFASPAACCITGQTLYVASGEIIP